MNHLAFDDIFESHACFEGAWDTQRFANSRESSTPPAIRKRVERLLTEKQLAFPVASEQSVEDEHGRQATQSVLSTILSTAKTKRQRILYMAAHESDGLRYIGFNDGRSVRQWIFVKHAINQEAVLGALETLSNRENRNLVIIPTGSIVVACRMLARAWRSNETSLNGHKIRLCLEIYPHGRAEIALTANPALKLGRGNNLTHLDRLEAEAIHIIREVIAEAENPVMLYSVGKDSSVMLHLARKAFYPSPPPFPLLHVDTRWKFQAMYDFRDHMAQESGMDLLVHINPEGIEKNINPLDHGSALHTDIMKTQSLKQALNHYRFDVAFGGARRDEEKSRAKERVFSFRTSAHRWDPKNQRPELWNLYNGRKNRGESIRVFPLSNWTELDIWQYIYREQIPIVPLYFAAERPVIERDGMLMMVDDNRLTIYPNEQIQLKKIRFRTLGCYPLTGAIESDADDLASIVLELLSAKTSERQGRMIDSDSSASMEKKKQEGYF
jgi:sulfate adenylyltransferase subunit 2